MVARFTFRCATGKLQLKFLKITTQKQHVKF